MMRTARQQATSQRIRIRPGFTLLETLVALWLCGLIVAALGTATHLYWKYRAVSKGQVHTTHLVRGLTEDLSETLRSVTPIWDPLQERVYSHVPTDHKPDFPTSGFRHDISLEGLQITSATDSVPFVGMSQLLAVLTEHPSARFGPSPSVPGGVGRQHIIWWINDGSGIQVPLLVKGGSREFVEVTARDIDNGLVRTTISANGGETARGRILHSQLISSDVLGMFLRYFDGIKWTDDWSTRDAHEIPLLVEFTLLFGNEPSDTSETSSSFVIAIPQGKH